MRELTGDDIVSCSFDQQVSSDSSFDIGTAIIGQMNITLNNHDGRFDACDFTDSKFKVWVGKELSTGTEWIQRGLYTANQPDAYNGTIEISGARHPFQVRGAFLRVCRGNWAAAQQWRPNPAGDRPNVPLSRREVGR